jgi:hypothetical protein
MRGNLLVDAQFVDLDSVIDVGRSDDQSYGLALLDGDRARVEFKFSGDDFDLNGRL